MKVPDYENAKKWWQAFRAWRLGYRMLACLTIAALALFLCFRENLMDLFSGEKPRFLVLNPLVMRVSRIYIEAENKAADSGRHLKVEYDGVVLKDAGVPLDGSKPQRWYVTVYDKELPEKMLKEGFHELRVALSGEEFCDPVKKIVISKKAPVPSTDRSDTYVPVVENSEIQTVEVSSARELVQAIKPNTVIKLEDKTYNLSLASYIDTDYVSWVDTGVDGFEPLIHDIYNLSLVGGENTRVVIEPKYAWVMNFQHCKNIRIEKLTIGHVSRGYCSGGVLSFSAAENIEIKDSVLFGSGTTGIQIDKVDTMRFTNSSIRDCSYNLMQIFGSSNIVFEHSTFENTEQFDLITIDESGYNIAFVDCVIRNNRSGSYAAYLFRLGEDVADISLINSRISGNQTEKFINQIEKLTMENNTFLDNSFSDVPDVVLSEYIE